MRSTLDQAVRVRALDCYWASHLTLTLPLSTLRCINGYQQIICVRLTLQWISIPLGSRNTPSCFMLQKPEMSHLDRIQTFFTFSVFDVLLTVLIYGILFYPFFACLTTEYKLIGSLLGFVYGVLRYVEPIG